jgi:hypothetical protein
MTKITQRYLAIDGNVVVPGINQNGCVDKKRRPMYSNVFICGVGPTGLEPVTP